MQDVEVEIVRKPKRKGDAALVTKIEGILADFRKQFAEDLQQPATKH
jgi:hypothetical protein